MAEIVFQNPAVIINNVSLTDHVRSMTINYEAELKDITASGSSGRKRKAGLKNWTASIEFNQDYAASKVDATLFPLVGNTTAVPFVAFPNSSAVGAGNPKFSGNCHVESYVPIGGAVGEEGKTSPAIVGHGVLARSTS